MSTSASASPSALPANVTVISIHPMYSAWQVVLAAFLGSALGAGWLIALNYKRLGERTNARIAAVLSVLVMASLIAIAVVRGDIGEWLMVVPTVSSGPLTRYLQGAAYDRHVGVGGTRASSWRAAGVGVLSLGILFSAISGAVAISLLPKAAKLAVGDTTVFYTEGVSRAEAQSVGETVLGRVRKDPAWRIEVTRDGDRPVVAFIMPEETASKYSVRERLHRFAEPLSHEIYGDRPVDIWLVDRWFRPYAKLTWEMRDQ